MTIGLVFCGLSFLAACSPQAGEPDGAIDAWQELMEITPLSHTTPHPGASPSSLDSTYARLDPSLPQWWLCRRCADYRPAGGIWKLQFEGGVMRILYELTGWRSVASFSVVEDRVYLFNDPYCPQAIGHYSWRIEEGQLDLAVIEDECAFGLRAENLSAQSWSSCQPHAGSVASEWETPVGCEASDLPPPLEADLRVSVRVHPGNSRQFAASPDLILPANLIDAAGQEGVLITFDENSISYGLNRVLWWDGPWMEVSSERPFTAMGVQFMGDPSIGWARILFDDVEVWHGDTAQIWSELGRHGGYVEVSGFDPGAHTLRVESMGFDYHPVTVAWFGFSLGGEVEAE